MCLCGQITPTKAHSKKKAVFRATKKKDQIKGSDAVLQGFSYYKQFVLFYFVYGGEVLSEQA